MRRDRADLQRRFRQRIKQLADHRIDALARIAEGIPHGCGAGELEARIGAQVGEEGGAVALEANAGLHVVHPLEDAGNFGQANIVDLVGCEVGRGVGGDQIAIKRRPTRHGDQAGGFAGDGEIFDFKEIPQADQRWIDPLADHLRISHFQAGLVCSTDIVGEFLHRLHHDGSVCAAGGEVVQLVDDVVHHQLGLHHAGLHALAEPQDRKIEQQRELVVALQRIFVIFQ